MSSAVRLRLSKAAIPTWVEAVKTDDTPAIWFTNDPDSAGVFSLWKVPEIIRFIEENFAPYEIEPETRTKN